MIKNKDGLLVIGGSGFVGRNLINKLKDEYVITSVSRTSKIAGVKNINLDLIQSDFNFLRTGNYKYVIYLGMVSSPKEAELKPQEEFDSNVSAVQRFLEKSKDLNFKKIIFLSSVVLYLSGNKQKLKEGDQIAPFLNIYNYSKYTMETLAEYYREKYLMPITVFRLANTYGPHQTTQKVPYLIPNLFKQGILDKEINVLNISPVRDWVFVDDVVEVLARELKINGGGLFNLGTGTGRSVGDVAKIVSSLTKSKVVNLNKKVNPPYHVICDVSRLKERIGYVPSTTLEVGLEKTFDFLKG